MHNPAPTPAALQDGQQPYAVHLPGQPQPLRLWLYLPPGYSASTGDWPLVVFLHGSGQRGTVLADVLAHGPPQLAARGAVYPFILCSPQLESGRWDATRLHALLPALAAQLRVDRQRISATGLSLGGHGVWDWAARHPKTCLASRPCAALATPPWCARGAPCPCGPTTATTTPSYPWPGSKPV